MVLRVKTLVKALVILAFGTQSALLATTYTTVAAANLQDVGGSKIGSGKICVRAVNPSTRLPLNFRQGSGGLVGNAQVCASISNGTIITPLRVPDSDYTYPLNVGYILDITDARQGVKVASLGPMQITGALFNIDNYNPSVPYLPLDVTPVQPDWAADGGLAQILNKPPIAGVSVCSTHFFATGTATGTTPCAQPNYSDLAGTPVAPSQTAVTITANLTGSSAPPTGQTPAAIATVLPLSGATQGLASANTSRDWPSSSDSSLAAQIAVIGSSNKTLLIPAAGATVTSNLTIPANITLNHQQGGILSCTGSITITIQGNIAAEAYKIFDASCTISFAGNVTLKAVEAKWFGAFGDGTTDDTAPLTAAAVAASSGGKNIPLHLTTGTYRGCNVHLQNTTASGCPTTAECPSPARVFGDGGVAPFMAVIQGTAACGSAPTDFVVIQNSSSRTSLEGFRIDGNATTPGTGANCMDLSYLGPNGSVAARNDHDLLLSSCRDASGSYGLKYDNNGSSMPRNIQIINGTASSPTGLQTAFEWYATGDTASLDNIKVYSGGVVSVDAQNGLIKDGAFLGGLTIGHAGSSNNNWTIENSQIFPNAATGNVITCALCESVLINESFLTPSGLNPGQYLFSGVIDGGVILSGGHANIGSGGFANGISSNVTGLPKFTLKNTYFNGTVPVNTSSYLVELDNVIASSGVVTQHIEGSPMLFKQNVVTDATGSSSGSPRVLGFSNAGYMQLQFGDNNNVLQGGAGDRMQFNSYWQIELGGNQRGPADFAAGGAGDASVSIVGVNGDNADILDITNHSKTVVGSFGADGSLMVPNVTNFSLTPGNCVQAGTGGLNTTTPLPCGPVAVPGSSSSSCVTGSWAANTSWHYDCVATNTWRRIAETTF